MSKTVHRSVRLDTDTDAALVELARSLGVSRATVISQAITWFVETAQQVARDRRRELHAKETK